MSDTLATLATLVGAGLKSRGMRLALAESCTGGGVAHAVTAIPGSSEWFDRGFVTYSNEAKQDMLGGRAETLERHGAVSEETAREMAGGALLRSRAHLAVSITGVAGPGGGTPAKPVGLVCFAVAAPGGAVDSMVQHFSGDRDAVRRQAAIFALQLVLERLEP